MRVADLIQDARFYANSKFVNEPPHQKNFYNFLGGTITCGKCEKKFQWFHWCKKV